MIQTKYHGEVEKDGLTIITFEHGIPAFEEEKEFILLPLDECFSVLQSACTPYVAFVVANIFMVKKDYDIQLADSVVEQLKLQSGEDVQVYGIVTVHEPFTESTINLKAPIVINKNESLGKQVVLNGSQYETKTPVFSVEENETC